MKRLNLMYRRSVNMMLILFSVLLVFVGEGGVVGEVVCPRECTCEEAPMRAAPFVLTWMTSWGEEDLPNIHPNGVLDGGALVSSSAALSAGVDVDVFGIHATCALLTETNLTSLTHSLPKDTMVLTVLQSIGGGVVVVGLEQLAPLKQLRALHLQGYARRHVTQISGYFPNTIAGMVAHKEAIMAAAAEDAGEGELQLAVTEDALNSLTHLQLLDLQYVRLVAGLSEDGSRLRRQVQPVTSDTLLDLPLPYFLSLTQKLKGVDLPPELLALLPRPAPHVEVVVMEEEEADLVPYEVLRAGGGLLESEGEEVVLAPFSTQTELRYLRVAHARLDRVGAELLGGLGKLDTLTLEHNNIKVLPPSMFSATPQLRHLSLAHNNLLALDATSLTGLQHLVTLDLDHNQLEQLGPGSFPPLPSLATLRLLANPLTHVFPFTFSNMNATETLLIGSREVSVEVHEDTFSTLTGLTTLRLDNTSLSSLSRSLLAGMPRLRDLTLHGDIPSIDYDAFTATPLLHTLTLSHSHLDRLSQDAFLGLRELRFLDLSHNELTRLIPGTFDYLVSLRELYLHHNLLTSLPPAVFHSVPVKLIQLHQNPWHCSCRLLQLAPTITNKVRQPGYTKCRWDEKAGTVCVVPDPVPLRFDSRVAPLCATPVTHRHFDVFHVATRRLKCSKREWDPRFTHSTTPVVSVVETRKTQDPSNVLVNSGTPVESNILSADVQIYSQTNGGLPVVEEETDWVPLTSFSSPRHQVKDLLEIAEAEMPEEAYAPVDYEGEGKETRESSPQLEESGSEERGESGQLEDGQNESEEEEVDNEISIISVIPSAIQEADSSSEREATIEANMISGLTESNLARIAYLQEKQRIRESMAAERRQRQGEVIDRKQSYWRRLAEEKRREKARREQQRQAIQERKEAQMEEFLREQEAYRQRMAAQQTL